MAASQDNGTTFSVENEDHTLANSLRFFLNKDPNVTFCGYSMPHPSEEVVNVRVQTTGRVTPSQAMKTACEELKQVCGHMTKVFNKELAKQRASSS